MLATLSIDDDVMRTAERTAAERLLTVDQLVSDLLRTALAAGEVVVTRRATSGFPVFHVPPGTPLITSESVRRAEEEDDVDGG